MRCGPVGECIYCGDKTGALTDEHIVPYGLGGNVVLPKASCNSCQTKTSRAELEVLRNQLLEARTQLGLPSRKKSLPEKLPLSLELAGKPETVLLSRMEHPTLVLFLLYPLPAVLGGDYAGQGINVIGSQTHQLGGPPLEEVMKKHGSKNLTFTKSFNGMEFEKMLAKIAYGFAVAKLGIAPLRDSPLRDTILGKKDDAGMWVGGGEWEPPPVTDGALHQVTLENHPGGWLIARVRLFATGRVPEYIVVVKAGDSKCPPTVKYGGDPPKPREGFTAKTDVKVTPRK